MATNPKVAETSQAARAVTVGTATAEPGTIAFGAIPVTKLAGGAALVFAGLVLIATVPMSLWLVRRARRLRYLAFTPMSFLRSYYRGVGFTHGVLALLASRLRPRGRPAADLP